MDYDELKRLVRESYPFPIAHAHKKTMGLLDDDAQKLKCLLETAEATIQFLALTALAQLRHDLQLGRAPGQPGLYDFIRENLRNPSFGKWTGILREVVKGYHDAESRLVVPELFDFCFQRSGGKKLRMQPVHDRVVGPLNNLRNDFHHLRIPESQVAAKISEGLELLNQLLEKVRFLSGYQLSFIQRIMADRDKATKSTYTHDLVRFSGCFSTPDQVRWTSEILLQKGVIVFLHGTEGKHLILNPFVTFADRIPVPGVQDVFLLNKTDKDQCFYVSSQFGQTLGTRQEGWADGPSQQELLIEFFARLRMAKDSDEPVEIDLSERALPQELPSLFSTAEVFQKQYLKGQVEVVHASPYKFLEYYNPEDYDLFFGRDREIRVLQQKFHGTRLLVLHGESGAGKSSLIRAGLIPRLSKESYVAVYVRALKEPTYEIKQELIRQLKRDERNMQLPLAHFIQRETELLSKTVVIVLDQFEEFFLRLPEEVRQEFRRELGACLEMPQLDVKFLISLRDDFFARLAEFEPAIPQVFTHQLQLLHLSEAQALDAVVEPPKCLGIEIDEAMVREKILPELLSEEGVDAPLLQIVCDALYQNANGEGRSIIDMRDFEAIGDVKGTLGRYLEEKLRQFGTNQREAKEVLKALVTAQGTKEACFVEDLVSKINSSGFSMSENELKQNYLDKFIRDRLVRVDEMEGHARYELSHEYLVRHIEAWIEETDREFKKIFELIDRAFEAFKATGLLLEASALDLIAPFRHQLVLTAEKEAFLDESSTRAKQKRRGLLMRVAAMLVGVAFVTGGFFGYNLYRSYQKEIKLREITEDRQREAQIARKDAERKRDEALRSESEALGSQSSSESARGKRDLAFQLASKGLPRLWSQPDRPITSAALQAFFRAQAELISRKDNLTVRLPHNGSNLTAIKISPDGQHIATAAWDGTVRIWDSTSLESIANLRWYYGPPDEWFCRIVTSVDISQDGTMAATANLDGKVRLWQLPKGELFQELPAANGGAKCSSANWGDPRSTVLAVSFDATGERLVSTAADGTVAIWDTRGGSLIETYQHSTRVNSAVFDRTRQTSIILIDNAGLLRVYNFKDKSIVRDNHMSGSLMSLTLSSGGKFVLVTLSDGTTRLLEIASGKEIRKFTGHSHWVTAGAFGPKDAWVATGSDDGTVRLSDVSTGVTFATLPLGEQITGIAVAKDTGTVFISAFDGRLHVWRDDTGLRTLNMDQAVAVARARFNHSPWNDQSLLLDPEPMRGAVEQQVQPSVDSEPMCEMADDPDDPEHIGRGIESYRLNRQRVLEVCNAAILKARGNGRYHYNVARALAAQGDFASAEKQYRAAIDKGSWIAAVPLVDMLRAKHVASNEKVNLLETASEHGVGVASWRLSGMFWRGELTNLDKVKSIEMGLKAAIAGVPAAHVWLAQNVEETTQGGWLALALFHYTVAAELYEERRDFFNSGRQHVNRARIGHILPDEVVAEWFQKALSWHPGDLPRESFEFAKSPDRVLREPNKPQELTVYEQPRIEGRSLDGCLKSSLSATMFGSECSAKAQREIASHFCRAQGYSEGDGKTKDTGTIHRSVKLAIEPGQALDLNYVWAPDNRGGFIFAEITCK